MAVSKVILNGVTLIDTTDKTVSVDKLLDGYTALKNDGTSITGSYVAPTPSSDLLIILTKTGIGSVSQTDFVISSDSSGNNVITSAAEGDTIYLVYKKKSGYADIKIYNVYTLSSVDILEFSSPGNSSYVMPNYPLIVTYSWSR